MSLHMNQTNGAIYDAAIYARLSDDDADKGGKRESESIVNQKEYIREYLKSMRESAFAPNGQTTDFQALIFFVRVFRVCWRMSAPARSTALS